MSEWLENTIHTNGIDIHYWRTGGGKPPIILSHGLTDNARCWRRLAETLGDEYDLIMPDARGHGLSSAPEAGYRSEDRAADVLGLMDVLDLDQVVAIGHSMGAETSALLAAQAPDRVRATVLEDPPFRLKQQQSEVVEDRITSILQLQALNPDALIARGREHHPTWSIDTFEPWAEAKYQVRLKVYEWFREPRTDWRMFVGRIQAPSLLLTGEPERGAIVTPEAVDIITEQAPSVQTVLIERAGHCIRYEQFDVYISVVRNFLRKVIS